MGSATQMKSLTKELEAPQTKSPATGGDPASRKLLLLLHGEKANDDMLREAIVRLRKEGHQVTVRVTYEAGDVDRLVKEALTLKSADTLVAAGGDGTVCEVVDALLKHTGGIPDTRAVSNTVDPLVQAHGDPPVLDVVSVAILPMGTSNDFAATTGLPEDPYEALLLATQCSSIRRIDVGLLNGKVFMNTATIGASADAGKVTSTGLKKILGPFAFLVTGVRSMRRWIPVPAVLNFPNIKEHGALQEEKHKPDEKGTPLSEGTMVGETRAEGSQTFEPVDTQSGPASLEAASSMVSRASSFARAAAEQTGATVGQLSGVPLLHLTAANNRQIASMVAIAPNAVLDDGMLDCVYFAGGVTHHAHRMLKDLLTKGPGSTKVVSSLLRIPWLEVVTETPLEWSLDGDAMPETTDKFRFSLLHRAIQIHLPDDRMLVAGQPEPAPEDEALASKRKHRKHGLSNPLRMPRGRLHPPSLSAMIGSVVRFRKKKNWGAMLRSGLGNTVRFLVVASIGGAAVHYWRRNNGKDETEEVVAPKGGPEVGHVRRERRQRRKAERALQKAAIAKAT